LKKLINSKLFVRFKDGVIISLLDKIMEPVRLGIKGCMCLEEERQLEIELNTIMMCSNMKKMTLDGKITLLAKGMPPLPDLGMFNGAFTTTS